MSSLDYYPDSNGPAVTQHSEDPFITYCLISSFILFCVFPLLMYFKDSIFWTLSCIGDSIHHISLYIAYIFNTHFGLYTTWKELKQLQPQDQCFQQPRIRKALIQIPPPPEEFLTKVREQLIVFSSTEQAFIQIPPPLDEFLTAVREQLIVFSSTEQTSPIQDIQQEGSDSQVFETKPLLFLHTPNIFIEWTYSPLVIFSMSMLSPNLFRERRDV